MTTMNHDIIRTAAALLIALPLALLPGRPAQAGTGGRERQRQATYIYTRADTLQPNKDYVIETYGLSSGADTILTVVDRPEGNYRRE